MVAHLPNLPKRAFPIGGALLLVAALTLIWCSGYRWVFWANVALLAWLVGDRIVWFRRASLRGWVLASPCPEIVRYGKLIDGRWGWLEFIRPGGGPELLVGSDWAWGRLPSWAQIDRRLIVQRLASKLPDHAMVCEDERSDVAVHQVEAADDASRRS